MEPLHADELENYLHRLTAYPHPVLKQMEKIALDRAFPIVGHQVGRLLYQLASLIQARRVLELGSGFGYSACWFALAMAPDGEVILTDHDEENLKTARRLLREGDLAPRFSFRLGDALGSAGDEEGPFDILFADIDKPDYPKVVPLAKRLLRPGGILICDNTLWSGYVARDIDDAETSGVREFNERVFADEEFFSSLMPVRDGVTISIRQ